MQNEKPNGLAASIVVLVEMVLVLGVSMGWFALSDAQIQNWINFAVALLVVATPAIGFLWARTKQTTLIKPQDSDGTPLVREDAQPLMMARK